MSESRIGHRIIPSRFGDLLLVWREEALGPRVIRISLPSGRMQAEEGVGASYPLEAMDHLS